MADDPKPDGLEEENASERPSWLPDNFTDEQALVESYQHSQRKITEQGNELSQLRSQVDTLTESLDNRPEPQYQPQLTPDDLERNPLVIRYRNALDTGDVTEMLRVQAEISEAAAMQAAKAHAPQPTAEPQPDLQVLATLAEQQARAVNPDYDEYEARAMEILQDNPHLFSDKTTLQGVLAGTNAALNMARGEAHAREQQTLAQKQAQAEQDRERKLAAQGVPGGGTRPPSPDAQQATWEAIKNAGDVKFRPSLLSGQ